MALPTKGAKLKDVLGLKRNLHKELHVCKSSRLLPKKADVCVEGRDQGVIKVISRSGRRAFFLGNMTGPSVNKAFMTPCSGLGTMAGTGMSRA